MIKKNKIKKIIEKKIKKWKKKIKNINKIKHRAKKNESKYYIYLIIILESSYYLFLIIIECKSYLYDLLY